MLLSDHFSDQITIEKRGCWKAERRWWKNNLQIHYDIFKERLCIYNQELRNSRSAYFSDIITRNSNNARALLATVDRLINPPKSVAPELQSARPCNEFATFFTGKIQEIRQAVSASISSTAYVMPQCPHRVNWNTMTQFRLINKKNMEDMIQHLNSSTCCLDILPTVFLHVCLRAWP